MHFLYLTMKMISHSQVTHIARNIALISTISVLLTFTTGHQPPGFLSIDCGGTAEYTDSRTNLTWERDGRYMLTGMDGEVPHPPNSSIDNYEALRTFRYFPQRRNKYCYELPMGNNISILIRATFLHGNSSLLDLPITFDVYLNATRWTSVQYDMEDSFFDLQSATDSFFNLQSPKVLEGIFYSSGSIAYFCLVPTKGVPFISSLELRQLDPEGLMYSNLRQPDSSDSIFPPHRQSGLFLSKLCRYNYGAPKNVRTVRYPDDQYDRFWTKPGIEESMEDLPIASGKVNKNTGPDWNNVPEKVMMTALITGFSESLPMNMTTYGGYLYAAFYCQALNNTFQYREIIEFNGVQSKPFNVTDVPIVKTINHFRSTGNNVELGMWANGNSTAILNAVEVYEELIVDPINTDYFAESNLLNNLKKVLNLTDWQGDPCYPFPDDWIVCNLVTFPAPRWIPTQIFFSNLHNTAKLSEQGSQLPTFKMHLTDLSVTYSDVNDATLKFLASTLGYRVVYLNLTHNKISSIPTDLWVSNSYLPLLPYSIDLSHNLLTGEMPTFGNVDATHNHERVGYLNLSYNLMSSFSPFWGNSSTGLFYLRVLDISHNSISSDISSDSLFTMLKRNPLLKELNMSNNKLTGTFPDDFYFSKKNIPNLSLLNMDGNSITGVLNLSIWLDNVQEAYKQSNQSLIDVLYSFVHNDIKDVIPDVDSFENTIRFMMKNFSQFNHSGILLGGNPFCKSARSFTRSYLCRSSVDTIIFDVHRRKINHLPLILGIIFAAICFFVLTFIIWRLQQKLYSASKLLQEIQLELTSRRVQPPFYQYHDLKVATKNFHDNNKLGSGAFGAVYKGVFVDGTTIAVKRLFNSEKEAVLNDFLNEVVLITGIKHRNLIQLKGCCIKDKERILVYEFARNGNLAEALWGQQANQKLKWGERVNIATGVARGLSYLHEELQPRIIHRDIKAANILLNESHVPKVADFGLARLFEDEETQAQFTAVAGTRGYFAPEYVLEGQLTTKADVYSFGILLLEIVTGRRCIDITQPDHYVYLKNWVEDLRNDGSLFELLPPELGAACPDAEFTRIVDIALQCTQLNPKLRPHMSEVITMLSGNLVASTGCRTDASHREVLNFSALPILENEPLSRSPSGFAESVEIPLVGNPLLSHINFNNPVAPQQDWLSRLRSGFINFENIPFRRSLSTPGRSTLPTSIHSTFPDSAMFK